MKARVDTAAPGVAPATDGNSFVGCTSDSLPALPTDDAALESVIARVLAVYHRWNRDTTLERRRADWDALFSRAAVNARQQPVTVGGVAARWVDAPLAHPDHVLLYFHGGGFSVGSTRSHLELMAGLSAAGECRVLGVDYRLAPEHLAPAALEDACAVYEGLLAEGRAPSSLAFGGDSAGAGLALCAMLSLRDRGRPLPSGAVLLSAWTDLSASGASYASRATADPIHQRPTVVAIARRYLGAAGDPRDPRVSPLFADLRGLPPLLLQVGDRETVLSDSVDFEACAREAGVDAKLEVYAGMIHVFQQFPDELASARRARAAIGGFLRQRFAAATDRDAAGRQAAASSPRARATP